MDFIPSQLHWQNCEFLSTAQAGLRPPFALAVTIVKISRHDSMSQPADPVEAVRAACMLTRAQFETNILAPSMADLNLPTDVTLLFETASSISSADFEACFGLIRDTSSAAYKASSRGWSPRKKKAEMKEDDMRFLLLRKSVPDDSSPGAGAVVAFLSFMITVEDELPVAYCYEVHVTPAMQGRGLGATLMSLMHRVGVATSMEKAMLTVFTSNHAAIRFYQRIGYYQYDEEVVKVPIRLRTGGKPTATPSYIIMAKDLGLSL